MPIILLSYPSVTGEVSLSGYEDLIACQSISMSTSGGESTTGPAGKGSVANRNESSSTEPREQREQSHVGVDNLSVTKMIDQTTPKFLEMAFQPRKKNQNATIIVLRPYKQTLAQAQAEVRKTLGKAAPKSSGDSRTLVWHKQFLQITLTNVNISSHEIELDEESAKETIKIGFDKIHMKYTKFVQGKPAGSTIGHIDLTATKENGQ